LIGLSVRKRLKNCCAWLLNLLQISKDEKKVTEWKKDIKKKEENERKEETNRLIAEVSMAQPSSTALLTLDEPLASICNK
jgi:hypothetical protein